KKHFPESPRAKLFSKMPGDALSIEDYLKLWLATEKENIKHSTWLGYAKILKYHLVPTFGKLPLSELRRKHIYDWVSKHADLSAKTGTEVVVPFGTLSLLAQFAYWSRIVSGLNQARLF